MHVTQSYIFSLTFPLVSSGLFSLSCQCDVDELEADVQVSGTLMFHCSAFCCLFLLLQENPCLVGKEYLFLLCCKACHKFQIQTASHDLMLTFLKCLFCAPPPPHCCHSFTLPIIHSPLLTQLSLLKQNPGQYISVCILSFILIDFPCVFRATGQKLRCSLLLYKVFF